MKSIVSFLLALISFSAFAEIRSIHSITEICIDVERKDELLLVFDIDDTLTILSHPAFHRPNFSLHHASIFEEVMQPLTAEEKFLAFTLPLLTTSSNLIELETPEFLNNLQQAGVKIIALTAATGGSIGNSSIEDRRISELNRVGIDFSSSFPHLSELIFTNFPPPMMGSYPLFKNGVILANTYDKGEVLVQFLKTIEWKPVHVIFVDDRLSHVCSVEKSLNLHYPEVTFTGLHYNIDENSYETIDGDAFSQEWRAHASKAQEVHSKT